MTYAGEPPEDPAQWSVCTSDRHVGRAGEAFCSACGEQILRPKKGGVYLRRRVVVGAILALVALLALRVATEHTGKGDSTASSSNAGASAAQLCEEEVASWADRILADSTGDEYRQAQLEFGFTSPKFLLIAKTYEVVASRALVVGRVQSQAEAAQTIRTGCAQIESGPPQAQSQD